MGSSIRAGLERGFDSRRVKTSPTAGQKWQVSELVSLLGILDQEFSGSFSAHLPLTALG
jgi:hypothetical protein